MILWQSDKNLLLNINKANKNLLKREPFLQLVLRLEINGQLGINVTSFLAFNLQANLTTSFIF